MELSKLRWMKRLERANVARVYRAGVRRLAGFPVVFAASAPLLRFLAPRVVVLSLLPDPISFGGITLYHGGRPSHTVRGLSEGVYEPETQGELALRLQPGDMFVDVGAHIGLFSVLAARLVGSRGQVLAFEPDPDNFRYLQKNVEINAPHPTAVVLVSAAVGRESGTAEMWTDSRDSGSSSLIERSDLVKLPAAVEVLSLDSWAGQHGWPAVRVIKLDCEGSEIDVILGMHDWCRRGPIEAAVVEVNTTTLRAGSRTVEDLFDCLRDRGYTTLRDLRDGESVAPRSRLRRLARESSLIPINIIATG